jgi:hypothetical protein
LLFADEVPDDQSDKAHAKRKKREHHQDSNVLRLSDDTVWISFASCAGESQHGVKRERLKSENGSDNDSARFSREIPSTVGDEDETSPTSNRTQNANAEFSSDSRLKTRPQPETAITKNCEEEKDIVEVFQ